MVVVLLIAAASILVFRASPAQMVTRAQNFVKGKRFGKGEETMKSRNLITDPWNTRGSVVPPEVPEERQKNGPSPAEIRKRAFEIHVERGGIHGCDLNGWLEAEGELPAEVQERSAEQR